MDKNMKETTRDFLHELLKLGEVEVTFTKRDGTTRIMNCTLKEDLIDEDQLPSSEPTQENIEILKVYDLDVEGWRSFRIDSLQKVVYGTLTLIYN